VTFRIDCDDDGGLTILRAHGHLVGGEAEQVLRDQIVRAVAKQSAVVLDIGNVAAVDSACLAVIQAGIGDWLTVENGGEYLNALLGNGHKR
jgi:anti-anti-sigma regulatory factor